MVLFVAPGQAQDLAGVWQGVEVHPPMLNHWPAVLTLKTGPGGKVTGVLFQEVGGRPDATGTFELSGTRTPTGLQLEYLRVLAQTGMGDGFWCLGSVTFTYDAAQDRLVGRTTFRPMGDCSTSSFELFRVRLQSGPTVPVGTPSTLRVFGSGVEWFADSALRQPLATGNSFRTTLTKATTFYVVQKRYANARSQVIPVRVGVRPVRRAVPAAAPVRALTTPASPEVLPTVLFRLSTAELLPEALPALNALAARLRARPSLRLQIGGHTDQIGNAAKNRLLSEQRAQSVRAYLVQAGIAEARLRAVGFGDARLRYPTPDPRNRRVEIEVLR